jgi:hypothetical protein
LKIYSRSLYQWICHATFLGGGDGEGKGDGDSNGNGKGDDSDGDGDGNDGDSDGNGGRDGKGNGDSDGNCNSSEDGYGNGDGPPHPSKQGASDIQDALANNLDNMVGSYQEQMVAPPDASAGMGAGASNNGSDGSEARAGRMPQAGPSAAAGQSALPTLWGLGRSSTGRRNGVGF